MKIVPVIKCSDLQRSLRFYTEVLDFERKWPGHQDREMANGVVDLIRDSGWPIGKKTVSFLLHLRTKLNHEASDVSVHTVLNHDFPR
jgi:catechol 2,3-dioxygenase-like lactoylglutathione lyase family enzyme